MSVILTSLSNSVERLSSLYDRKCIKLESPTDDASQGQGSFPFEFHCLISSNIDSGINLTILSSKSSLLRLFFGKQLS